MVKRVAPSQQIWEEIETGLCEGSGDGAHPLDGFVLQSARYVLQVAIEKEVSEYLGRQPYERRSAGGTGYRNGYESKRVVSEAGRLQVALPQVRECPAFHSELLQRLTGGTPALRRLVVSMYVRGLSTRDIEACFEECFGGPVLSKSAVSEVTQTLGEEFDQWKRRDLSSSRIVYLFLDGHYLRLREGTKESSGILCAYGITETGQKVLLSLMLGEKESEEAWLDCLRDLVERCVCPPLLVVADGAPGLKKAVRKVFPKALYQRCQAHKLRNILCKVPKEMQRFLHKKLIRVFHEAPDYPTAVHWGKELIGEFEDRYPSAMDCLAKDLEECLTSYKFPIAHWKRVRTTNLLERTFGESRRRTKVIPYFATEQAGMNLMFAALITHAKKWRGVKINPEIQLELVTMREKLYKLPPPKQTEPALTEEVMAEAA